MTVRLKKHWRLALAVFLTFLSLLVWWTWPVDEPFIAELNVPGSPNRLRLLRAEMGPIDYEPKPRRSNGILAPLRELISKQLGAPTMNLDRYTTGSPVFLFSLVDEYGRHPQTIRFRSSYIEFVESTGFAHGNSRHVATCNVTALLADSIPRRDSELRMRICSIFEFNNRSQPMEIQIRNPFYQSAIAEWTPQAMGTTVNRGGLNMSLQEISISSEPPWATSDPSRTLTAQFKSDSPSLEWNDPLIDFWFEDATGNRGKWLSPFEPAWKVVGLAYRNRKAPHPASMVTDLGKIKIPPAGQIQPLNKTLSVDGFNLKLVCVCGGGTVTRINDQISVSPPSSPNEGKRGGGSGTRNRRKRHYTCGQPFLLYECDAAPESRKVYLRLNSIAPLSMLPIKTDNAIVELNAQSGETEHTLELVDSRPERFEFVVAPPEVLKKDMLNIQREP